MDLRAELRFNEAEGSWDVWRPVGLIGRLREGPDRLWSVEHNHGLGTAHTQFETAEGRYGTRAYALEPLIKGIRPFVGMPITVCWHVDMEGASVLDIDPDDETMTVRVDHLVIAAKQAHLADLNGRIYHCFRHESGWWLTEQHLPLLLGERITKGVCHAP